METSKLDGAPDGTVVRIGRLRSRGLELRPGPPPALGRRAKPTMTEPRSTRLRHPRHLLSISPPTRRLTLALTLALSLGVFAAALLGPSQTLAKAHVSTCAMRPRQDQVHRPCLPTQGQSASREQARQAHRQESQGPGPGGGALRRRQHTGAGLERRLLVRRRLRTGLRRRRDPDALGQAPLVPRLLRRRSELRRSGMRRRHRRLHRRHGPRRTSGEQACEGSASEGSSFVCEGES